MEQGPDPKHKRKPEGMTKAVAILAAGLATNALVEQERAGEDIQKVATVKESVGNTHVTISEIEGKILKTRFEIEVCTEDSEKKLLERKLETLLNLEASLKQDKAGEGKLAELGEKKY